jgi:hypothetical protein
MVLGVNTGKLAWGKVYVKLAFLMLFKTTSPLGEPESETGIGV